MALMNLDVTRSRVHYAGQDTDINNTFSWPFGEQGLLYDDNFGESPAAFVCVADPEPGYNPYYGAPGFYADKVGDLETRWPRMPQGNVGVNPWDHVFGGIGADPYQQSTAARYIASQEGTESFN
jgi:hypothetical protein